MAAPGNGGLIPNSILGIVIPSIDCNSGISYPSLIVRAQLT